MSASTPHLPPGTARPPEPHRSGRPSTRTSPLLPDLDEPAGFTLARLAVLLVVVIAAARFLHAASGPAWALVAATTVWALGTATYWLTPLAGAGLSWLLGTGFLEHRTGELSFSAADRGHLVVLVLAALVALLIRINRRSGRDG